MMPGWPADAVMLLVCRSLGCLDTECSLCAQNPHRRCEGNFAGKYLAGDVLKAKCGASIRVEVLDRTTAESVSAADGLDDIRLEVSCCNIFTHQHAVVLSCCNIQRLACRYLTWYAYS